MGDTFKARRYDAVKIKGMKPHRRCADGALLFEGVVTREGVLEYRNADGTVRRELVTRQAVIDTAKTMPRSTLTLEHPPDGMVTPDNYQDHAVGDIDGDGAVEEDAQGGFVRVKLAVRRRDAIEAIEAGIEELSAGYMAVIDPTPGEHPVFGRYDVAQVGRVCNHTAIVPAGRAGGTVSLLRADSTDAAASTGLYAHRREDSMHKNMILLLSMLGVGAERMDSEDDALRAGLDAAKRLRADAERDGEGPSDEEIAKMKADAEDLEKQNAELLEKIAGLEEQLAAMKATEQKRSDEEELASLRGLAAMVKMDGADALDRAALRLALVRTKVTDASDDWADARMDGVLDVLRADAAAEPASDPASLVYGEKRADSATTVDEFFSPTLDHAQGGDK